MNGVWLASQIVGILVFFATIYYISKGILSWLKKRPITREDSRALITFSVLFYFLTKFLRILILR